jgi:hypothetical protein
MSSPGNSSAGQAQDSSLLSIELQMKSLLVPPETVCDFDGITPEDFSTETNVNSSKKKQFNLLIQANLSTTSDLGGKILLFVKNLVV